MIGDVSRVIYQGLSQTLNHLHVLKAGLGTRLDSTLHGTARV